MPLLDQTPARGERHWLAVRLPFYAEAGKPFWCLYQPWLSHSNGWSEHPEELGRSAVVRCTLLEVHDPRLESAYVRVAIDDVLTFDEIGSRIPLGDPVYNDFWQTIPTQTVCAALWGDFTYVHGSFEGDVTGSALFEKRDRNEYLILYESSDAHSDFVFVCNSALDAEAASGLRHILTTSGKK
jgi:hypothetical protein